MFKRTTTQGSKRSVSTKLIAGFAALLATTVITASGFAAATSANNKPTKEWCRQAGFSNYGQCVKEWARNKNRPGGGYGGGNSSIITNIELALNNSNNNVIQIVINVFR